MDVQKVAMGIGLIGVIMAYVGPRKLHGLAALMAAVGLVAVVASFL